MDKATLRKHMELRNLATQQDNGKDKVREAMIADMEMSVQCVKIYTSHAARHVSFLPSLTPPVFREQPS